MPLSTPGYDGGTCELHGAYSPHVSTIRVPKETVTNLVPSSATELSILTNPLIACDKCKIVLGKLSGYESCLGTISEEVMPPGILEKTDPAYPLMEKVFQLGDIFADIITDIYLVPTEEVSGTRFEQKPFNVVFAFKSFSIQSYTAWLVKSQRSAAHLWNSSSDRQKFWSTRQLRLLLALSKLHLGSTQFNIWIASYTRIVSIEYFCTTPPRMVQLTPSKLYKVK